MVTQEEDDIKEWQLWAMSLLSLFNIGPGCAALTYGLYAASSKLLHGSDTKLEEELPFSGWAMLGILPFLLGFVFIDQLQIRRNRKSFVNHELDTEAQESSSCASYKYCLLSQLPKFANPSYLAIGILQNLSVPSIVFDYIDPEIQLIILALTALLAVPSAYGLYRQATQKAREYIDVVTRNGLVEGNEIVIAHNKSQAEKLQTLRKMAEKEDWVDQSVFVGAIIFGFISGSTACMSMVSTLALSLGADENSFLLDKQFHPAAFGFGLALGVYTAGSSAICHKISSRVGSGVKVDIIEDHLTTTRFSWRDKLILMGDFIGHVFEFSGVGLVVIDYFLQNDTPAYARFLLQLFFLALAYYPARADFSNCEMDYRRALRATKQTSYLTNATATRTNTRGSVGRRSVEMNGNSSLNGEETRLPGTVNAATKSGKVLSTLFPTAANGQYNPRAVPLLVEGTDRKGYRTFVRSSNGAH